MSWQGLLPLVDPVRRALYELVRQRRRPVTREEAAGEVGISARLAAFHLDKLVRAGLLRAHYAAPAGPRGPGRTPKVYEPAGVEVAVSIPERRYDLLGEVLVQAVAESPGDARTASFRLAEQRGAALGRSVRRRHQLRRPDTEQVLRLATQTVAELGYEPRREADRLTLANCPFHALARRQTDLVCGLNWAFLDGVLRALGGTVAAVLAPADGRCCVQLVPTARSATSSRSTEKLS